ncbi:MAG: 2-amino-4-hydroxy-6-hydroxymethyldihydropteridine diphosphokinase [Sulfurospirillum sp.]|nr:2-amino-4-hydroxy-6-hydroxymethyldihydropteridine diphosphokinase [Sulfurospirillum sp.]
MLKIHKQVHFPQINTTKSHFKHTALVGIGGNVGNVLKRFERVYYTLQKHPQVWIKESSFILQNPPFGFADQNDFYNAVLVLQTTFAPRELLKFLLHVEKIFKRRRSFKNAPRTLDLDIIFFDDVCYRHKKLIIPHPHWQKRDSVIIPMASLHNFRRKI